MELIGGWEALGAGTLAGLIALGAAGGGAVLGAVWPRRRGAGPEDADARTD